MSGRVGFRGAQAGLLALFCWLVPLFPGAAAPAAPSLAPAATFLWSALHALKRDAALPGARRAELQERFEALETRLSDGTLSPEEASLLRPEFEALRRLLAGETAPLLAPLEARSGIGGGRDALTLQAAAAVPSLASGFFDGRRTRRPAAVSAPAYPAPPRETLAVRLSPVSSDLRIPVPGLGGDPKGGVVFLSKRVARVGGGNGRGASYEVGVADLLGEGDPAAREKLSRDISAQALAALKQADSGGQKTRALGDFLRDIRELKPPGTAAARLSIDEENHYRLIFELGEGGRKIFLGQFLPSSRPGSSPPLSFIVMGRVDVDALGRARQERPGYWREYSGAQTRLDWISTSGFRDKGWGPWARKDEQQDIWTVEQEWKNGAWRPKEKHKVKTVDFKEGKSWLGRTGAKIMDTPGVGSALKLCDTIAAGLYTGLVGAANLAAAELSGSDSALLEAAGSYSKNPAMNRLIGDRGHLDRLTPAARLKLEQSAREARQRAVDAQLFPLSPEMKGNILKTPVGDAEAAAALRDNYGAGSYGKRLIHAGGRTSGWKTAAYTTAGVAAGVAEALGEGVMNPILWATLGTGEAVAALKGAQGARAGLAAMRAAHAAATAAWWGPWLFTAADNTGRLVELTAEGGFDKEYFHKLGLAGADALYLFVVP